MARIGIYGGSFNPPHNGHILAAQQCVRTLALDRLLLVPDSAPPHKVLPNGSPTAQQRFEMVQLAARGIVHAEVCDAEVQRGGASYTVDTLRQLKAQYPKDELLLLMGTDMFLSFDTWREPDAIGQMAELVCMYRQSADAALRARLDVQCKKLRARGCRCRLAENDALELSSTTVRRMLFFTCAKAYLPQSVLDYICANRLYGVGGDYHGLSYDALRAVCLPLHNEKRVAHVIGTSEFAAELARRYGADAAIAARAGILHDVTKALGPREQLALCDRFAVELLPEERENPKLLHAVTASVVAREIFGECEALCSAVRWHTTGKANMTLLEKILYIADYAEPNRSFDGVERLRETLSRSLDDALLLGLSMTMEQLRSKGQTICGASSAAYAFLQQERNHTCHS